MPSPAVLDASAVLAVILKEPGCDEVFPILDGGLLSTVNLAEVHSRLLKMGIGPDLAWNQISRLGLEMCLFTEQEARAAAELIARTQALGLSLGDRACLALATERKAKVYTADRAWKSLSLGIEVEVIR